MMPTTMSLENMVNIWPCQRSTWFCSRKRLAKHGNVFFVCLFLAFGTLCKTVEAQADNDQESTWSGSYTDSTVIKEYVSSVESTNEFSSTNTAAFSVSIDGKMTRNNFLTSSESPTTTLKSSNLLSNNITSLATTTSGFSKMTDATPTKLSPDSVTAETYSDLQKTTTNTGPTADIDDILGPVTGFFDVSNTSEDTENPTTPEEPPPVTSAEPTALSEGFCYQNISRIYKTGCVQCSEKPCGSGYVIGTDPCQDVDFECSYECRVQTTVIQCCDGYVGSGCEACPGGSSNPCNGNGKCQEGYPMCRCDPGFAGTACELCNDTRYGEDCSQECACVNGVCSNGRQGDGSCSCYSGYKGAKCDEKLLTCDDLQCMKKSSVHSRCIEVDGIAACDCDIGYRYNASLTDCVAINPCENPKSPCGLNSVCMMVSPGRHTCTCEQDFTGDGIVCMPINPCDVTVGICGENTRCSMIGPNKHICHCNIGYWNHTPGVGCSLINVCSSKSCPKNAICETYEPYTFRCMCKEGFISRNKVCIGNIYQTQHVGT